MTLKVEQLSNELQNARQEAADLYVTVDQLRAENDNLRQQLEQNNNKQWQYDLYNKNTNHNNNRSNTND